MWIPNDIKNPVVKQEPTRKKVSVFGSVNVSDGRLVYSLQQIFNAKTFLEHLNQILEYKPPKKKILLILDNARYHHAKILLPWLESNKRSIELLFLPPYSPELNPIEHVWKRERYIGTHNRFFPTITALKECVADVFDRWAEPNNELLTLCAIKYVV
jgi:transposase